MATYKIRYFVEKPGRDGMRFFWQPSEKLRKQGWRPKRLAVAAGNERMAAIHEAEGINKALDSWRAGDPLPDCMIDVPAGQSRPGTISALIDEFKAWMDGSDLQPITRRGYGIWLEVIRTWAGDTPVQQLTRQAVIDLYAELKPAAHAKANAVLRVLRILLNFAKDRERIKENPAAAIKMVATKSRDAIWPDHAIEAFVKLADAAGRPSLGTAVMLAAFTGQRQGDLLRLTRAKFIGGRFRLRQGKTNRWVDVKPVRELADRLNKLDKSHPFFITSEITGRPYTSNDFNHNFVKIRKKLIEAFPEYADLQFLDLRRTAVVRLGEAGCTEAEIAAITGHKIEHTRQILETYLPRTTQMADNAIAKLEDHRGKTKKAAKAKATKEK